MRRLPSRLFLAVLLLGATAQAARPYRGGVVATAYPQASAAALEMLDKGGNAVDAAVAAAFAAGVVGPYHNGIGGGGFALVSLPGKETLALDFREVAPAAATRDMYLRDGKLGPGLSTDGGLAVAVPNAAHGYLALLDKAGTLKRSVVLAPAIRLARNGFRVTPKYQQLASHRVDCLRASADAARTFLRPGSDGAPDVPPLGTVIRQPELARTLQQLAAKGGAVLRSGPLARALADGAREAGGILTADDLARIQVHWRTPLAGTYRGYRVVSFPPPSAGGIAVLQVLGVLERLRPDGYQRRAPADVHLYIEALRRSFAERGRLAGDPDQIQVPTAWLISPEHIAQLAASIDPARATPSTSLVDLRPPQVVPATSKADGATDATKNTAHISVMDRWGARWLTTTVNTSFGARVPRGTGVLLNKDGRLAIEPGAPTASGW
jgi:gamma-glutamyltranspeptidase/glutathione hydrolase